MIDIRALDDLAREAESVPRLAPDTLKSILRRCYEISEMLNDAIISIAKLEAQRAKVEQLEAENKRLHAELVAASLPTED